jgi:hypothetical protein
MRAQGAGVEKGASERGCLRFTQVLTGVAKDDQLANRIAHQDFCWTQFRGRGGGGERSNAISPGREKRVFSTTFSLSLLFQLSFLSV